MMRNLKGNAYKLGAMVISAFLCLIFEDLKAQGIPIDVNLNVKHRVGEVTEFSRRKFITIHADTREPDWNNVSDEIGDAREHFLNGYDVYLGRTTHNVNCPLRNSIQEDPNRPGYADPESIMAYGNTAKNNYANNPQWHLYEDRDQQVLCNLDFPFIPVGIETNTGWELSNTDSEDEPYGTASGEFYGRFIRDAFGAGGTTGQPAPQYIEIVNEPLWPLVDWTHDFPDIQEFPSLEKIFRFHKTVAEQVKIYNPGARVGGYVTAHPNFEIDNFSRWNDRWKTFMDIAGHEMDFWAVHFYDAPAFNGKEIYRKGSNLEASLDMMEHYSFIKYGYAKPFVISEYGAVDHEGYHQPWSPFHDWLHLKAVNSMMLQFMERANLIDKTINYVMLKGSWVTDPDPANVWGSRLFRYANEPESKTGDWVYTDRVKTFQLWSEVNGTRVDTRAGDLDIMVDAYVNGNKAYLIINSLALEERTVALNLFGVAQEPTTVKVKKLFATGNERSDVPVLEAETLDAAPVDLIIPREGTYILEYTYPSDIVINETSTETKYYATEYLKPINAATPVVFAINNVAVTGGHGEAILRLGVGRDHGRSLKPVVKVNDSTVFVPTNYRGDTQDDRDTYFGVLEIDVPVGILEANNTVSVTFNDDGGHVSSVAMQVFDFTNAIGRSGGAEVTGIALRPDSITLSPGSSTQLVEQVFPYTAFNKEVSWLSGDTALATVTTEGLVTANKSELGEVTIYVTAVEGNFVDSCKVSIEEPTPGFLRVDDPQKYINETWEVGTTLEVVLDFHAGGNYEVSPELGGLQVMLREVTSSWAVVNDYIFSNDAVVGRNNGTTSVTVDLTGIPPSDNLEDGNFYFLFPRFNSTSGENYVVNGLNPITIISSAKEVEGTLHVNGASHYTDTEWYVGEVIPLEVEYDAGEGYTVSDAYGGIQAKLIELNADSAVVREYVFVNADAIGKQNGTSTVSVDLAEVIPSPELSEGNYYMLLPRFKSTQGVDFIFRGLADITILERKEAILGLSDTLASWDIKLLPNPAKQYVVVHGLPSGHHTLEMIAMDGQAAYELEMKDDVFYLPVNLKSGVYVLREKVTGLLLGRLMVHKH